MGVGNLVNGQMHQSWPHVFGGESPPLLARPLGSLLDDLPHGILQAADGVLDLALGLLGLAVRLQLGIAGYLADGFLDRAFDASRGSRDPILIHDHLFLLVGLTA